MDPAVGGDPMPDERQRKRDPQDVPGAQYAPSPRDVPETDAERRRRRAHFLRELNEAKALRDRVQPRRARAVRMRQAMRMRTFRW